jgi:hypothetical protein
MKKIFFSDLELDPDPLVGGKEQGSGSTPKCHGSPTRLKFRDRLGGLTYDEVESCVSRRVLHHQLQAGYLS